MRCRRPTVAKSPLPSNRVRELSGLRIKRLPSTQDNAPYARKDSLASKMFWSYCYGLEGWSKWQLLYYLLWVQCVARPSGRIRKAVYPEKRFKSYSLSPSKTHVLTPRTASILTAPPSEQEIGEFFAQNEEHNATYISAWSLCDSPKHRERIFSKNPLSTRLGFTSRGVPGMTGTHHSETTQKRGQERCQDRCWPPDDVVFANKPRKPHRQ